MKNTERQREERVCVRVRGSEIKKKQKRRKLLKNVE